jgi:hypothetical protein
MIKKSLIINYILQIILFVSLFVIGSKFMHAFKLVLLISSAYLIYALSGLISNNKNVRHYNYFYVAIVFVFALYASGFRGEFYYNVLIELIAAAVFGLFLCFFVKIGVPKKENAKQNKNISHKEMLDQIKFHTPKERTDYEELKKEVKAIEEADRIIRKIQDKKVVKKTTTKPKAKKVIKKVAKKTAKKTISKKKTSRK